MATTPEAATERLVQLGFSTSETRTYVGLLGTATGYAVANVTDVPKPELYATLRRLEDRAAVAAAERTA
jgi:sugar-specific transcriptional regulator TrmB